MGDTGDSPNENGGGPGRTPEAKLRSPFDQPVREPQSGCATQQSRSSALASPC
jgi:hypothetical protein